MSSQDEDDQWLRQLIIDNLPQNGVSLAFGYGSKIVKQINNRFGDNDMLDFIIAVDNPYEWHSNNYKRNPGHYSFVRYFPNNIGLIVDLQERYGAKIYYNPYVKIGTHSIKYGIIKTDHLIDDLQNWTTLYVAGRLHKPVRFIQDWSHRNKQLGTELSSNKESAIKAGLLQLPETFKRIDLYKTITGLSYAGDFRMWFGENKNKVGNIVNAQFEQFDQLYTPLLKRKDSIQWDEARKVFHQDLSPPVVLRNLESLPKNVRNTICRSHSESARSIESNIILNSLSKSVICDQVVSCAIASIVRRSSFSQSLKGVLSAGLIKSLKYSQKKILKSIDSRLR